MKMPYFFHFTLIMVGVLGTAQGAWNRLPTPEAQPVNLASGTLFDTALESASREVENPVALVGDDIVATMGVPRGRSEIVLKLARQMVVNRVAFANLDCAGALIVTGSQNGRDWMNLGRVVINASEPLVAAPFAPTQVKYVKLSFDSPKGGRIRAFNLHGTVMDRNFVQKPASPKQRPETAKESVIAESAAGATVNLANGFGRVIYANPTPRASSTEDAGGSNIEFPETTTEKHRTVVYDLGNTRAVREFEATYTPQRMRMEVFVFRQLPEVKDWRGQLSLDPAVLEEKKPLAVAKDPKGVGHMRVDLGYFATARFVALRFEPDYDHSVVSAPAASASASLLAALAKPFQSLWDRVAGALGRQYVSGPKKYGWCISIGINGFQLVELGNDSDGTATCTSVTNPVTHVMTTTTTRTFSDGSKATSVTVTQPTGNSSTTGNIYDTFGNIIPFSSTTLKKANGSSVTTGSFSEPGKGTWNFTTTIQKNGSAVTTVTPPTGPPVTSYDSIRTHNGQTDNWTWSGKGGDNMHGGGDDDDGPGGDKHCGDRHHGDDDDGICIKVPPVTP